MKAAVCRELGPPENLSRQDLPEPVPGADEVLIAVKAAGVNFPDALIVAGKYQERFALPFAPGMEVSGIVLQTGANVRHLAVGDAVTALNQPIGGYAERVVAPARYSFRLKPDADFAAAATLPVAYGTTMHALTQRAQLRAGETLLVLGAAGGVGIAAIQIGKLLGARVIAAASTPAKLELCKAQGADALIDYSRESLKDAVKKLTGGQGADVIYDPVGGDYTQDCFSAINWNGRHLVIGFSAGTIPQITLNRLLLKGAATLGVFNTPFVKLEPERNAENFAQLLGWFGAGRLRPHVSKTYALADAGQALRDLLDRKVVGKIALTI